MQKNYSDNNSDNYIFQAPLTGPVLLTQPLDEENLAKLKALTPEIEYIYKRGSDITPELVSKVQIVYGSLSPSLLKDAASLNWLHLISAGADRFANRSLYASQNMILTSSVGAYGVSVSEHMLTLILCLLRRIPVFFGQQKQHKWDRSPAAVSVHGLKAVIVGLGDIGINLARLLNALGARVSGVKKNPQQDNKPEFIDKLCGIDKLDELLAESDIVALCLPSTPETAGIISRERISKMKSNAIIVNAGRGTAIDPDALYEFLSTRKIAGAGLDVTSPEPLPPDSRFWDLDNVIITPHVAGAAYTNYTSNKVFNIFYENMERIVKKLPLINVIDFDKGY